MLQNNTVRGTGVLNKIDKKLTKLGDEAMEQTIWFSLITFKNFLNVPISKIQD